ncbi:MAG: hypothetical protein K2X86_12510 [Cytophagaceae bacterium]|nr:hypothetical protein [Cytophagaceae bacterium]
MKNINLAIILALSFSLTIFTACQKDEEPPKPDPQEEVKQSDKAGDAEMDEAIEDVNDMINNNYGGGWNMKMSAYNLPCGVVSVDSSTTSNGFKVYKINYGNATPCGYKYKSGQVSYVLENGPGFNNAGAIFIVTFTNYKVEVQANGSIITLNGTIKVTNLDGGYIWQAVTNAQTIRHKIRGALDITFANGQVRQHKYYQVRTWSNASSGWAGLTLTIAADTTINSVNVSEIGRTLEGDYYYETQVTNNFVWGNCGTTWAGPYLLKSGLARLNVTIPFVSPAYIDVEAGYKWNYTTTATPTLVNDCQSNAYKITTVIITSNTTTYQLY